MDLFNQTEEIEIIKFDLPNADVTLYKNFFKSEESSKIFSILHDSIQWKQEQAKLYDKTFDIPRLQALYGDSQKTYTYAGIKMTPIEWTPELLTIKNKVEETVKQNFTSVLINLYRSGNDCVHWHADDKPELGENPTIASVSFGETRTFKLRHKFDKDVERISIQLEPGCLLLMQGTTQHFWEHEIPKSSKDLGPRINLTFRQIKNLST